MILSLNWLKDYVEIPNKLNPEELAVQLTMHTVEVEGVQKQAEKFKNIKVGKILEISKHPNADKLQLVKVDLKNHVLDIVCGASNIAVGQVVPVAMVGAVLPSGLEIKEAEIRGQKSFGMLCAEDELGLGEDRSGIMLLNEKAKIGQDFSEYLKIEDVIFEVDNKSITHRPDLWSHYGMARDISAFLNVKTTKKFEQIKNIKIVTDEEKEKLEVKVEDFKLCPRYMGVIMDGIKIDASPKWLQDRLISVGVRPINNIVDITNYVMMELGQPMHAFDKKLVDKIIVRSAGENEEIETLDGENRKLNKNVLVIADSKKAIAVAGVMGGSNSEISDETDTIIFESANFDFFSIRKTSQKLGLRTEASVRFEKALDPNLAETALARATELVKEIIPGAKVISKLADEKKINSNQEPINFSLEWLSKFLGQDFKKGELEEILKRLGFDIQEKDERFSVVAPTWRASKDIAIKEDVAEEIARIYGFNEIITTRPEVLLQAPEKNKELELINKIKFLLAGGPAINEVYNYSFVNEELLRKLNINFSDYIKLANPISAQHTMLRQNLAPNLFLNVKTNQPRFEQIKIFEIGSTYFSITGEINKDFEGKEKLPYQEKKLGILIAGNTGDEVFGKVKGAVDYLMLNLNLKNEYNLAGGEVAPAWAAKKRTAKIKIGQRLIGFVSVLDKKNAQNLGIKKDVAIAEIGMKDLCDIVANQEDKVYREIDKFPPVVRDLAFVVNDNVLYNDIKEEIINFHQYIKEVELFDVYQGEKIGEGNKNLAFHVVYQADRTLTAKEIDGLQEGLIKIMEKKFDAKIRNF